VSSHPLSTLLLLFYPPSLTFVFQTNMGEPFSLSLFLYVLEENFGGWVAQAFLPAGCPSSHQINNAKVLKGTRSTETSTREDHQLATYFLDLVPDSWRRSISPFTSVPSRLQPNHLYFGRFYSSLTTAITLTHKQMPLNVAHSSPMAPFSPHVKWSI